MPTQNSKKIKIAVAVVGAFFVVSRFLQFGSPSEMLTALERNVISRYKVLADVYSNISKYLYKGTYASEMKGNVIEVYYKGKRLRINTNVYRKFSKKELEILLKIQEEVERRKLQNKGK